MRNGLLAALASLAFACLPQTLLAAPPATLPVITVRALPGTDPSILHDLAHVRPARGAEPAALQLDLAHQRVLNGAGQVVAGPDAVRTPYLQSVVDKWRYVASLGVLARAHPQELHSDLGDDGQTPQGPGMSETIVVPHVMPQRQLLLFGIGPSGGIYLLSTRKIDSDEVSGDTMMSRTVAVPPFGAEHTVAVSAADPQGMHELGVWLRETTQAHGTVDTQGEFLKQIAALRDVRIGLLASYTCGSASECTR
jgi:hypothetical protein